MKSRIAILLLALLSIGGYAGSAYADSPTCTSPEKKLSWPLVNPTWEMCWLPPDQSAGPRGSGMELRKVYFKGHLVFARAHAPMLFAEYKDGDGGDCYRDWKDDTTPVLSDRAVQNKLGTSVDPPTATTACDRSHDPTASYGTCAFQLPGYPNTTASCFSGVAIEDGGDHVTLTTQYRASWYMYASRWTFFSDGRIEPSFGFGNNNGTYNNVTHWHHNYWRMEFNIDGGNNTVSKNNVDQSTEFTDLRSLTGGPGGVAKTWEVRNPTTGNGYRLIPGSDDYTVPTNQSGRGFHTIDVMATRQHDNEYGDNPNYDLGDCAMDKNALVNNESLANSKIALYYRVAVRDSTSQDWPPNCSGANCIPQDSMECKKTGPTLVAFGPWAQSTPSNPTAAVAPGNVELTVDQGATATDTFGISNSGDPGSTLNYTINLAASSCANPGAVAWLSATPASGGVLQGATAPITATINAASLAPGQYSAVICVHSNDTAQPLISVPVSATVNQAVPTNPTATIAPGSVEVTVDAGATATDSFAISNSGAAGSTLNYTINLAPTSCTNPNTVAWLSATPASGGVPQGAAAPITATVNAASLAPGQYSAVICVHSNDPAHALISVPISATVNAVVPPSPTATINEGDLTFEIVEGGSGASDLTIRNTGGAGSTLNFTLALSSTSPAQCSSPDSVPWLHVTPTSGAVVAGGTPVDAAVNVDGSGLALGTHAATICVGSNDPAHAMIEVPVSVTISADPDLIFKNGFDQGP